ncbi:DUF3017 domain-containing protein [Streptomyces avermitilis]|uniref:DUF3017 domain-containing protein n=1 Tax=Streptomyces avermitilis TaxID=33903 RepID=UPI0033CFF384
MSGGPAAEDADGGPVVRDTSGAPGAEGESGVPAVADASGSPGAEDASGGPVAEDTTGGPVAEDASGGAAAADASGAPVERDASGGPVVVDAVSAPDADGKPRRTTRRFPSFTRDTARPEGGGRAASSDAPAPARQWPILTVLTAVGLGLLLTALDVVRFGTILIGVALLAGAAMRWVLPDVGMLAVRSRFTDMVTYGVLGVAIVLLAMMAQPDPLLEIPFLDDTLHFTIRT